MNKHEALEKLHTLIKNLDELPEYRDSNRKSLLTKFQRLSKRYIEEIFGKKTSHLSDFKSIEFEYYSFAYTNDMEDKTKYKIETYNEAREEARTLLESFIEEVNEWKDNLKISQETSLDTPQIMSNKIFVVHGHDDPLKTEVELLIHQLGLQPIVLHKQADLGKTIIEKIEHYSDVGFALVLYTPCDEGKLKAETGKLRDRARQNVVFEHGYFIGKLGRERVRFLVKGDIEKPGDISGVVYTSTGSEWKYNLVKELKALGYGVTSDNVS